MQITVSSKNTKVSDKLKSTAEAKIAKLAKFSSDITTAKVHFTEQGASNAKEREVLDVTLTGGGIKVHTQVSAPDGYTAVDLAVDKLERQLRKLKTKSTAK